jgi:uncharacterized repeat protein (TIGR03803 family)
VNSLIYRAFSLLATLIVVSFVILAIGYFAPIGAQNQAYSVLYNFQGGSNGAAPYGALLLDSTGDLFGTTYYQGGHTASGVVFEFSASQNYSLLHSFKGVPNDGAGSLAAVISDHVGNLYGTTSLGGSSNLGAIFGVNPAGREEVLHSFAGSPNDGAFPGAPLLGSKGGIYYGTTASGGASNAGTVFSFNAQSRQVTILHSFTGPSDGAQPNGGLITDSSGNLYGTTSYGGAYNQGTLFEITAAGAESVLYSFTGGIDGGVPQGSVLRNAAGDLYTTTYYGGANGFGAIMKWSENGKEFVLYSFAGPDGAYPRASIIRDLSGNFYGTTQSGGAADLGVAFEFSNTQQYTVLHSFTGGATDGSSPYAPLVLDSSGNLYGTTVNGGSGSCTNGCGTIFKITP